MKTTQQDLILKMLDGSEAGQLVPIQVEQCLLGSDPQCAIIRTSDGVQAQCTKGLMLINDVETKVKWLAEGDTVTLGSSTFEIADLGHPLTEESDVTEELDVPKEPDVNAEPNEKTAEPTSNQSNPSNPSNADALASIDSRIKEFESLLIEQQQQHLAQTEAMEERFTHITLQLESLCDHLLEFEDQIEEQKLLTLQAIEKQDLLEIQIASQPAVAPIAPIAPIANGLAAISTPAVETFVTEPTSNEATAAEPVISEQQDSDTVVFSDESQPATEQLADSSTDNKTEAFLPVESNPVTESDLAKVDETHNSLLQSLGLPANVTTDSGTTQPESPENAIAASELDSVFGTANQDATQLPEEPTEIDAADTSELDSLLSSLQDNDQNTTNEPAFDADSGLGALESRITEAQTSLSNAIDEDSPATELNSLFNSLETESSETSEPATPEETTEEKPSNESVADVLARMNLDVDTNKDEENSLESHSVAEPVAKPETTAFAAEEPATSGEAEGAEGEGNVDDYMSALLQRLKSGPDTNDAPAAKKKAAVETAQAKPGQPAKPEPVKMPTLKPEEFVPKSVAKVQTNKIAEMRALANQSATNSVVNSNNKRNKEKTLGLQIGSLIGLFSGIILFLISHRIFDLFFILAVIATAIGAACLYLLYGSKNGKNAQADRATQDGQIEQAEQA